METRAFQSVLGFSLYQSNPLGSSLDWIQTYHKIGASFAFTSLNITEEKQEDSQLQVLLKACQQASIDVIVDINEQSLKKYPTEKLRNLGITALRIDDGISDAEIIALSKEFRIVLNASTLTSSQIHHLTALGIKLQQLIACHNFYPKPYTGLSLAKVQEINSRLHHWGIPVISFIPGEHKRFPLFEGLPTIEDHRNLPPLQAALESLLLAQSDAICIGDSFIGPASQEQLTHLVNGDIPIRAEVPEKLYGIRFENRIDASDYVIRAAHSRSQLKNETFSGTIRERHKGDIVLANEQFLRYQNELEICLQDLPKDSRQTIIGKVAPSDLDLLDLVLSPYQFFFSKE